MAKILLPFRKQGKGNREWVRVLKVLFTLERFLAPAGPIFPMRFDFVLIVRIFLTT